MQENKRIDLGGFTLYDSTPIILKEIKQDAIEEQITNQFIKNIHFIFEQAKNVKKQETAHLQSLPQEEQIHDFDRSKLYVSLPEPSIQFPRSKRLPEKKIPTKWEKFAKQKGIHKKKKTGMKYNKSLGKMVASWGAKSKGNSFEPAIMQEKHYGKNPFDEQSNKKQLKKQKQKLKQIKNRKYRQEHQ